MSAIGRASERDFLSFVHSISNIGDGGVYISIGSAIMSPMIFEKSLSMARNVSMQKSKKIEDFYIYVVDLNSNDWDWSKGEPLESSASYYLRYMKTFNRMGGHLKYINANNVDFLIALNQFLSYA